MKRSKHRLTAFLISVVAILAPTSHTQAQFTDIIKAIIKAADIAVQKVQNATIDLQNIQKQVENELSKLKLKEIADWTQQQKNLYQEYFNELWQVKNVIAYYQRITDIISKQKQLVAEYKRTYALVQQDKHFSTKEIQYVYAVYSGIVDESVKNLDQILTIVESFTVQMSDAERLKIISRAADGIDEQISDLKHFNNQNIQLSLQRSKSLSEINAVKQLYGL